MSASRRRTGKSKSPRRERSAARQDDFPNLGSDTPIEPVVKTAVERLSTPKLPPSESEGNILTRRLVVLSFWLVVICLGLPIWWKTTTVYRADLPLQLMQDWGAGKICSPVFPLTIALEAPDLEATEAQDLLRTTQHVLDDLNEFSAHQLRLSLMEETGGTGLSSLNHDTSLARNALRLLLKTDRSGTYKEPTASLRPHTNVVDISYSSSMVQADDTILSMLSTSIAAYLRELYIEEQSILSFLLAASSVGDDAKLKHISADMTTSLTKRDTRSLKYAPTYHLTFSLLTPAALPSSWDIEHALEETFGPLLATLASISNITIDTQAQPYAAFSPAIQPTYSEERKAWVLQESELGGFINSAEWPLSPSIGDGPTINFLLFVPDTQQRPLLVEKSTELNSWLVPQWGGVAIHNPPSTSVDPARLDSQTLQPYLLAFAQHLLTLLNVPETPTRSLPLRLSTLTRQHAASLVLRASNTLASLARLVLHLPSISIPDSAASAVDKSLSHLDTACQYLREGRFGDALRSARDAETEAEKAFFERSMVGQVYFPDEHKIAVYLPLLGPVAVPLVLGALRELRAMRQSRRSRRS